MWQQESWCQFPLWHHRSNLARTKDLGQTSTPGISGRGRERYWCNWPTRIRPKSGKDSIHYWTVIVWSKLMLQVKTSFRRNMPNPQSSVFVNYNEHHDKFYNAYEKDIAIAHFYFDESTVLQYSRTEKLTWTGFIGKDLEWLGDCLTRRWFVFRANWWLAWTLSWIQHRVSGWAGILVPVQALVEHDVSEAVEVAKQPQPGPSKRVT